MATKRSHFLTDVYSETAVFELHDSFDGAWGERFMWTRDLKGKSILAWPIEPRSEGNRPKGENKIKGHCLITLWMKVEEKTFDNHQKISLTTSQSVVIRLNDMMHKRHAE